ncbi:ATP-binding protein [Mucilaginibacter rubeus]|uniref:ATP-binding protein n=1 Tax=Mucilaginibacter rubeus TaxID=2027860 RepID=UPI00166F4530|nr:ATP-binding protein [Mucilaginibacter rubeus]GGA94758.1 hypothetical protein GCM10011500_08130 [Mucilaginibacter rubeus]
MTDIEKQIKLLKEQLNAELQKGVSDNNVLLSISHEIASLDQDNIRFSVDAGVINRLGKELVGRHESAVAELVKNAYDADATTVNLYFNGCSQIGGNVTIDDNGLGMTREQLVKGFMTISSSDKIHNPKSPRYKRSRAGQKGIGRFATQRIGQVLTIITQTLASDKALKVTVNWDNYAIDTNLLLVTNSIVEVDKEKPEGTTLLIENVRDIWTDTMISRAYKYISELLQPFPLSTRFQQSENDPGFIVSFYKNGETIIDVESAFFQHSLAEIEAYVDDDGQGYYSFTSHKLGVTNQDDIDLIGKKERDDKFNSLKNIHLKAYYFIYNVGLIPKKIETYIRQNARENGGIRLYRNGFRVLPYGEKDDDWLGLDASARRRTFITPHSNINFFGFIELIDPNGINFQEQSSREGLLANESLSELQDFGYKVLTDVALKISFLRERKGTAAQKNWTGRSSSQVLQEVKEDLESIIKSTSNSNSPPEEVQASFNDTLRVIEQKLVEVEEITIEEKIEAEAVKKELLKEIQLLRILAGLGLTIGEFVHEINHYEPAFKYDAELLTSLVNTEEGKTTGVRLQDNLAAFTVYTSYFKEAISKNVNRELEVIELRDAVYKFSDVISPDLIRSGITLEKPEFIGYHLFTCPMHMSEWASILFNFYTNSKKAIKKTKVKGLIHIKAGKADDIVYLEFSDNGIGIPKENEDKIFTPFFTTSAPSGNSANEMEELTGTGIGLKIVRDIVEGYGGDIFVKEPTDGFTTTIRIELPKA